MNFGELLSEVLTRCAEIERRIDGLIQVGPVASVDPNAGTVRVRLGGTDEAPFLSPPIPASQIMGALKLHSLPSIGQQVASLNPSGDYRLGMAIPLTQSNANPSPSQAGDEHVLTFGPWTIKLTGSEMNITGPKIKISGDVEVMGNFDTTGSSFTNNGTNVGSTHVHGGVLPGGADTLTPH